MYRGETLRNNRVIVRIWASERAGGEDVGHVSIEIPALVDLAQPGTGYYSLWPNWAATEIKKRPALSTARPLFMVGYKRVGQTTPAEPSMGADGYAYDFDYEGRAPEYTVCLYGLNVIAIDNKATEIKSSPRLGWSLLGAQTWIVPHVTGTRTCSCATFAMQLLSAGDLTLGTSSSSSSSVMPDQFIRWLHQAKMKEQQSIPELLQQPAFFLYDEETTLEQLAAGARRRTCTIL